MRIRGFRRASVGSNFLNALSLAVVNDALDDILADSGDEVEEEAVINQVLDEIGIEISGKVGVGQSFNDEARSCNTVKPGCRL